jgi:hypothetical protein
MRKCHVYGVICVIQGHSIVLSIVGFKLINSTEMHTVCALFWFIWNITISIFSKKLVALIKYLLIESDVGTIVL